MKFMGAEKYLHPYFNIDISKLYTNYRFFNKNKKKIKNKMVDILIFVIGNWSRPTGGPVTPKEQLIPLFSFTIRPAIELIKPSS